MERRQVLAAAGVSGVALASGSASYPSRPAILATLNAEMNAVLRMPDVRQRLLELGVEPQPTSPEEFGRFIRNEVVKWGRLVSEAGIKAA